MKKEHIVLFDIDSTLVSIEGLDHLAQKKGVGENVVELTKRSMNGEIPVEQAMQEKMKLIAPSEEDMKQLSREYLAHMVADAKEVIHELKQAGIRVGILTGNFYPAVIPIAEHLGIDLQNVFANNIEFNPDGSYKGYKENNALMHSEGKAKVIENLRRKNRHITHIGDSKGDLDAGADRFIGFGGVVVRDAVLKEAAYYIPNQSLAPILASELSPRKLKRMKDKSLVQKAQSGLLIRQGSFRR
jgi:phosphoserine phosphatase